MNNETNSDAGQVKETQRAARRAATENAIRRQMTILQARSPLAFAGHQTPGKFAKRHALNCGRPQCGMCGNPRRNRFHRGKRQETLTLQERRHEEAFRQDRHR